MLGSNNFKYDHEKYPLGYIIPGLENMIIKIVEVPRHDFTGTLKESLMKAKEWGIKNLKRTFSDEETGGKGIYFCNEETIKKFIDKTATSKSENIGVHLAVLKKFPEIIKNSILVEIHPDFIKKNGKREPLNGYKSNNYICRLYGIARIDQKLYNVKTTVLHDNDNYGKPHSFEVTKIELLDSPAEDSKTSSSFGSVSNNSISAAKVLKNIEMSYCKEKKLLNNFER